MRAQGAAAAAVPVIPEPTVPAPSGVGDMTEGQIVTWVENQWAIERNYRIRLEQVWQRGASMLMNQHDFTGKESWQSAIVISKVPNAINTALAIIKSGIASARDWYDIEGIDEGDKALAPYLRDLMDAELRERDPVTRQDFLDTFLLGLKYAMATAPLVMKIVPRRTIEKARVLRAVPATEDLDPFVRQRFDELAEDAPNPMALAAEMGIPVRIRAEMRHFERIKVSKELVDPFNFYVDHRGNDWEFERIRGRTDDLDTLLDLPESAGYRRDALLRAKEKARTPKVTGQEQEPHRPQQETPMAAANAGDWEGVEMCGNVPGPTGEVAYRDVLVTVIEGELVRLVANPFDDGGPYVSTAFEPIPFKPLPYGRGLVENSQGLAEAIIEIANAFLDSVAYEVLKAFELDVDQVEDPTEFKEGIVPGKTYRKRVNDQAPDAPMLRAMNLATSSANVLNAFLMLDRAFQEGTQVTELSQGLPSAKSDTTATEVERRRQGTNLVFANHAQWIEKSGLEPALSCVFHRMVKFKILGPGGDKWMQRVLGPKRAKEFEDLMLRRLVEQGGEFEVGVDFKVSAISNILARSQELARLRQMIEALGTVPGMANRVRLEELTKRIVQNLMGGDQAEILKSAEELERINQLEDFVRAQLAVAASQQPNSHTGAPGAAQTIMPSGT